MFRGTFNNFFLKKAKSAISKARDYFVGIKDGDKEIMESGEEIVTADAPKAKKEIYGEATEDGNPINYN
ncbi:hypothetical protein AB3A32_002618 [Vibrio alginolyticus]